MILFLVRNRNDMLPKIFLLIVIIQIGIVLAVGIRIKNQTNQNSTPSLNLLSKSNFLFPQNGKYKYFYEHQPNTIATLSGQFTTNLGYPEGTVINNYLNSDGLNQLSNYPVKKTDGIYRIVTLGDSFTFGENVNTKDNYPSQLENKLNDELKCKNIIQFQVINLGMEGYDISYAVERYKIRGQKYNPDLVLWFIIGGDLTRINELQIPTAKKYDSQLEKSGQKAKLEKQGIFNTGWHMAINQVIKTLGGDNHILDLQKKYFSEFNNYYKGPLLIFNFPSAKKYDDILQYFKNSRKNTFFDNQITNIYDNPINFLKDYHPSKEGYSVIVNDLFNYLTKNNIIRCKK